MNSFFAENKLFVTSAILLAGLVAGASTLQSSHDKKPVKSADPFGPTVIQSVAPARVSKPAPAPVVPRPVRPRVYNRGEDD